MKKNQFDEISNQARKFVYGQQELLEELNENYKQSIRNKQDRKKNGTTKKAD